MNAFDSAMRSCAVLETTVREDCIRRKQEGGDGVLSIGSGPLGGMDAMRDQGKNRLRYDKFRGWLYSAINALAEKAAGQPINVARLTNSLPQDSERRERILREKDYHRSKMPNLSREKSAHQNLELIPDHPIIDLLNRPNPIQGRWQFVYTFVANLNLTGRAYIVVNVTDDKKLEVFSLPTTWVTPIHKDGAFTKFKIRDPSKPSSEGVELDRTQVGFAQLPDPANPLNAFAPASSQSEAIQIDGHIQASQAMFFENGIFPSVVLTIGKNPIDAAQGGLRPKLTGPQRRQVIGAIEKTWGGVANYGKPAIVDGLIERIDRLSATQNEMGWDKSEEKIRTRILSAFGVHPFILGEAVRVGGHAQATVILERFFDRVNIPLDMLSNVVTNLLTPLVGGNERLLVWWEKCVAFDRAIRSQNIRDARKNGDINKNEYRAWLGFPPDLEAGDSRNKLLDSVGGMTGAVQILNLMGQGGITPKVTAELFSLFFEIPLDRAEGIVGNDDVQTPAVLETLQTLIGELKKPVKLQSDSEEAKQLVEQAISTAAEATEHAVQTDSDFKGTLEEIRQLRSDMELEQVERDHQFQLLQVVNEKGIEGILRLLDKQDADVPRKEVKDILAAMSVEVKGSLDTVREAIKQPIQVNVTNEVNPTPIQVTNEVEIPKTEVTVQGIQGPKGQRGERGDGGSSGAQGSKGDKGSSGGRGDRGDKGDRGEIPSVNVAPTINVEVPPANVKVTLEKEDCPRTATITTPDGRVISKIELED